VRTLAARKASPAQTTLAWLLHQGRTSWISGTKRRATFEENLAAAHPTHRIRAKRTRDPGLWPALPQVSHAHQQPKDTIQISS
jgi:aryl-alcohol dehydrogenase-like predicted oxidoreductase